MQDNLRTAAARKGRNCFEKVKKADAFGQNFSFVFDNHKSKMQSLFGVIAGVCMVILLLTYAGLKLQVMFDYGDNVI